MYDARQIANWFVLRAQKDGKKLSIMQLLKLVYIAHGWHLEITKQPLFPNRIEAWRHGPVIPDIYGTFRRQGIYISHADPSHVEEVTPSVSAFLEEIYGIYGSKNPFELSDITHVDGGPWDKATKSHGWFAPIANDDIKDHYERLRNDRIQAAQNFAVSP